MKRLFSIRLYHEFGVWHWADSEGFGVGHDRRRRRAFLLAVRGHRA